MSVDPGKRPLKLVIIDSHQGTIAAVRGHLVDKGVRVVGEADNLKSGLRNVRALQPDLLLIEVQAQAVNETLEAVQRVRADLPQCSIILSASEPSPQLIMSGMRAGAKEFVSRPVETAELDRALEHVRKAHERGAGGRKRSAVVSVFATKGGAGASSVATNLAVTLAHRPNTRVVLVDLNTQMGDLSLLLDLKPRYSLADVVDGGAPDETTLRSLIAAHSSGVGLLMAAASPAEGTKLERSHIIDVFGMLSAIADYVVVDVGRHIDERILEVLDLSDRILLLSTLSLPAIRNLKRYFELFRQLEIESRKFELVVNRFTTKKGGLGIRDLQRAVGVEVTWTIPNDYQAMSHAIDAGVPAVTSAARSKLAKSFQEYAERLVALTENRTEFSVAHASAKSA
jgi:pilus assembly protein CpaE